MNELKGLQHCLYIKRKTLPDYKKLLSILHNSQEKQGVFLKNIEKYELNLKSKDGNLECNISGLFRFLISEFVAKYS